MHPRASSVAWCLAAAACACAGKSSSGGAPIGSTADALHYCLTVNALTGAGTATCFAEAPAVRTGLDALGAAGCEQLQHEVDAGRALYDPAKGAACAEALVALDPCSLDFATVDPPTPCAEALTGVVAPGGACGSGVDCAGGSCSLQVVCSNGGCVTCSGQCVAWAAEGQPCTFSCAPGLQCGFAAGATGPTCLRLSPEGGPCPCRSELYCDTGQAPDGGSGPPPSCKTRRRSGFCTSQGECAPGFVCTGFPSACLPLVGQGAACGGAAVCGQGYYCDPVGGRCAALPDLGEGCVLSRDGTTADLPCVRGRCDRDGTKTCVSPKADGEPCTAGDECLTFFCDPAQQRCSSGGFVPPPECTPP